MSHQLTFANSEFSTKRRQTRKEIFLSRMEHILPWQNMTAVIEPFYPKAGNGRRPYPLETMLRIRVFRKLDTLVLYLQQIGVSRFEVDASSFMLALRQR